MMTPNTILSRCVTWRTFAAAALLIAPLSLAHAQFAMYDDFNSKHLSVGKWPGGWMSDSVLRAKRKVENGSLVMHVYGRNDTTTSEGRTRARQRVNFPRSIAAGLSGIEFNGVVTKSKTRGCDANPDGRYRSRLTNYINWGNDGSSTGADDETGDFKSLLGLRRYPGDPQLYVSVYVYRCADADCATEEDPRTGGGGDLGTVSVGERFSLRTVLNRSTGEIKFRSKTASGSRTATYQVPISVMPITAAVNDFTVIATRSELDNCVLGNGKKPFGLMEAEIDSVLTKPLLSN